MSLNDLTFSHSYRVDCMPKSRSPVLRSHRARVKDTPRQPPRVRDTPQPTKHEKRGRPTKSVATGMDRTSFSRKCSEFEAAILPVVKSMFPVLGSVFLNIRVREVWSWLVELLAFRQGWSPHTNTRSDRRKCCVTGQFVSCYRTRED